MFDYVTTLYYVLVKHYLLNCVMIRMLKNPLRNDCLDVLRNIFSERKRKRIEKYAKSIEHLKNGMDGLLLATKNHPIMWLFMLIRFVKSGRPFTVFCERREPLIECFVRLHDERKATNLQISDCFEREIQVLPERTHPLVMMPGNRGYILSGITVTESSESKMES